MCDENDQEDFIEAIKSMRPTENVDEHKSFVRLRRHGEVKEVDKRVVSTHSNSAKEEDAVNNSFRFSLLYKSVSALIKIIPTVLQASEKIKLAMKKGFRRKTRPV